MIGIFLVKGFYQFVSYFVNMGVLLDLFHVQEPVSHIMGVNLRPVATVDHPDLVLNSLREGSKCTGIQTWLGGGKANGAPAVTLHEGGPPWFKLG